MTSSMHDLSSHSDDDEADEQQKQSEPQIQYQSPATGIFHPGMAPPNAEYMMSTHLEVGHAVAQASYPYPDPYYRSIFAPYGGAQPMIHPHLVGIPQAGVPLPSDAVEEPVFVNAKQYHGIMRRRQSRAKAESENKLVKARKEHSYAQSDSQYPYGYVFGFEPHPYEYGGIQPHMPVPVVPQYPQYPPIGVLLHLRPDDYQQQIGDKLTLFQPYLHESRHLHALKRARGCGGRFLNAKIDESQENEADKSQPNVNLNSDKNH